MVIFCISIKLDPGFRMFFIGSRERQNK